MSEVNEVNQKQWIYDKAGKGRLCASRVEAEELIDSGEYSDHPNGEFVETECLTEKTPVVEEVKKVTKKTRKNKE